MLCEHLWKERVPCRESIISQTFMYLLFRCGNENSEIEMYSRRLEQVKTCIRLFDLDDHSSDSLKQLIIQLFNHHGFLSTKYGKMFLCFLFCFSLPFVDFLHMVIKHILLSCQIKHSRSLGDVYFLAWSELMESDEKFKVYFEKTCMQDLCFQGINLASPSSLKNFRSCFIEVIESFRRLENSHPAFESSLNSVIEPILWRSLNAANFVVRQNAMELFLSIFPISNPLAPNAEGEELLQQQFHVILSLLEDPHHLIRASMARAVPNILQENAELVGASFATQCIERIVELSEDSSPRGAIVRSAVLDGLKSLLQSPKTLQIFKVTMRLVRTLFHDKSAKVRESYVDVLLLIKRTKGIHFYDVCDIDQILYRLAWDKSDMVKQKLTDLLQNSYFPYKKGSKALLERATTLLTENIDAAKSFFAFIGNFVPAEAMVELVNALLASLRGGLLSSQSKKKATREKPGRKRMKLTKQSSEIDGSVELDASMFDAVICLVALLVKNISKDQPNFHEIIEHIRALQLDESIYTSPVLIALAPELNKSDLPKFSSEIVETVLDKELNGDLATYGPMVFCILKWGLTKNCLKNAMEILNNSVDSVEVCHVCEVLSYMLGSIQFQEAPDSMELAQWIINQLLKTPDLEDVHRFDLCIELCAFTFSTDISRLSEISSENLKLLWKIWDEFALGSRLQNPIETGSSIGRQLISILNLISDLSSINHFPAELYALLEYMKGPFVQNPDLLAFKEVWYLVSKYLLHRLRLGGFQSCTSDLEWLLLHLPNSALRAKSVTILLKEFWKSATSSRESISCTVDMLTRLLKSAEIEPKFDVIMALFLDGDRLDANILDTVLSSMLPTPFDTETQKCQAKADSMAKFLLLLTEQIKKSPQIQGKARYLETVRSHCGQLQRCADFISDSKLVSDLTALERKIA